MFSSCFLFVQREGLHFHKNKPLAVFGVAGTVLPIPGPFHLRSALNVTVLEDPFLKFCSPAFQALTALQAVFPCGAAGVSPGW